MKKEYFRVFVYDPNNNIYIPTLCETVCKTVNSDKVATYIFRDLITQKIIFPNNGELYFCESLTYDNYDKKSCKKLSIKTILSCLKGLDNEKIDMYSQLLHNIENYYTGKKIVRKIDN